MLTASASLPTTVGPYHIAGLIGQGGMARVYRALDPTLQRSVAIKLLTPVAAAVPGYAERFLQEARILAQLCHPNIVQVYDFGTHEGAPYMVQELLPGPTLEQELRDRAAEGRRLRPDEVMAIISQLAGALDAAHALGVIHRDVKPGNAIWNSAGALVLTDFGIAKQTLGDANQTQTGIVIGTPAYLSPEQAQGQPLTPASDVYALGVVLYELLAGVVPFPGSTPLHVALAHVQTPPPDLATVRRDLPPAVAAVVRQALAKEPAARFQSAGALADALARVWRAAGVAPAGSIHSQPTEIWEGAPAGARQSPPVPAASPTAAPPAAPATGQTIAQPAMYVAPIAPPAPVSAPGSWRLPLILGGLLAALFVLGALAAAFARGEDKAVAPTTTVAPAATVGADSTSPAAVTAAPELPPTVVSTPAAAPAESPPPDVGESGNGNRGSGNGNGGRGNGNGNGGNGNGKDKKDK